MDEQETAIIFGVVQGKSGVCGDPRGSFDGGAGVASVTYWLPDDSSTNRLQFDRSERFFLSKPVVR